MSEPRTMSEPGSLLYDERTPRKGTPLTSESDDQILPLRLVIQPVDFRGIGARALSLKAP
jgi:hypothetical protein